MVNLYRRLRRAESKISSRRLPSSSRGEDFETVRRAAQQENVCAKAKPPFVVTEGGVYCSVDGRPVTHVHQTAAEVAYWLEVGWREEEIAEGFAPHLFHDEDGQAFYAPDGRLILSRDYLDLRGLFACLDAAIAAEERGEGKS